MVIGNGMIANRFDNYRQDKDVIIFASGVSNSRETKKENFDRELTLLENVIKENPGTRLVYYSTCSVADEEREQSPYILHKKNIEQFVISEVKNYHIFRVPNVAGLSNNPYTLLNFLIFNILGKKPVTIWKNAERNIIGIDDLHSLANYIIKENFFKNSIINLANPFNYSMIEILEAVETHLQKKAIATYEEKGTKQFIDISNISKLIQDLSINFNDEYLSRLLNKYYHSR